jgi:pimeloyl-ACP methyl ester carboxylesterase
MGALQAACGSATSPTVVLVHGEFADASSWAGVIPALQVAGLEVIAPANPLRGLAADAAYLAGVAREIDGPVLLVGHAYGGAVITTAGGQAGNVAGLVYIAAFVPDEGERILDLLGRFADGLLLAALRPAPVGVGGGLPGVELYIRGDTFPQVYAADLPARAAAALGAAQRPVAAAAYEERARCPAWRTLPCWYAVATGDRAIPVAAQRFMARRAGAQTIEVDASHAITLSRPAAIAELIRTAACPTAAHDHGGIHECSRRHSG